MVAAIGVVGGDQKYLEEEEIEVVVVVLVVVVVVVIEVVGELKQCRFCDARKKFCGADFVVHAKSSAVQILRCTKKVLRRIFCGAR